MINRANGRGKELAVEAGGDLVGGGSSSDLFESRGVEDEEKGSVLGEDK